MTAAAPGFEVGHPLRRILIIGGVVACGAAFAELVGWDIRAWLGDVWDTLTGISAEYVVAAILALTLQTTATAFAWYSILRVAYPREVRWMQVYAAYAACVGMNNVLPANLGTFVMFAMLMTVIVSATLAGLIAGFLVEKIFFTIAGAFVYLYLFLSVPGSFDIDFSWVKEQPGAIAIRGRIGCGRARPCGAQLLAEGGRVVGAGEGGRPDPGAPRRISRPCLLPGIRLVASGPLGDRDLPHRLRDPGHLPYDHFGDRQQFNLQHRCGDPGRGGRQPGDQRRRVEGCHRLADCYCLLHRAAAGDDSVVAPARTCAHGLGVRLGRGEDALAPVV
jgi:hypothetical protein